MNFVFAILVLTSAMTPQAPLNTAADRVDQVLVSGNRRVPSETIKYNIQTKPGSDLEPSIIARDIRTLYTLGYFDDIHVQSEAGANGMIVTFVVKETPLIRHIEYKGLKSFTQSEVLAKFREKKVGLTVESPYDLTRANKAKAVLKTMLSEKGRQNATVETEVESVGVGSVDLTITVNEGAKLNVQKISIEGNQTFSTSQVKRAMKLVKEENGISALMGKDTYNQLKLADDVTRIGMLYGEHGFVRANIPDPDIEVKPTISRRTLPFIKPPFPFGIPLPFATKTVDRYYITIKIEENDQYRIGDVTVTGNKQLTADQIKSVLGLVPGEVFNEVAVRKAFENLKKLYDARGFINFTAVPAQDLDPVKKLVNLAINVDEDRQFTVNRISFSGNTTTRDKVIRREVMLDEGQIFNSHLWDLSVLRLNQLGYFEEIKTEDADIQPHSADDKVDINLKVKEKGRNSIGFNGGVSGVGGSFLGLSYSTNNFLGLGESMSLSLQGGSRESNYVFSFTEPYVADRPVSLGFTASSSRLSYDQARDVFGLNPADLPQGLGLENRLNFQQNHSGFNVSMSYPMRVFHRVGLTYQLDNSQTSAVNPATQEYFDAIAAQQQQALVFSNGGTYSTFYGRSLTPVYTFSSVNNPYNPSNGHSFTGSFEFTGGFLGGNVNYYRPSFQFTDFKPVNHGRNVLAMRIMTSYVQGFTDVSVPYYQRFFLGGDFDIRGFDFREISPIAFITRNLPTVTANGSTVQKPYDDIVYVGGDTQGVINLEYRIPLVGPVTLAPFLDAGNSWVFKTGELTRQVQDAEGHSRTENVNFLPGTNSGIHSTAGIELQVVMPVINAPFRLIFAINPNRIDRTFYGPVTGLPLSIHEPGHAIKFTVGRTF